MTDVLMALASGGATGIFGMVFGALNKHFQAKQQHKRDIELRREDAKIAAAEAEGAMALERLRAEGALAAAELEAAAERDAREAELRAVSYEHDTRRMSAGDHPALVWVDVVRGMTRPVLTVLLVATGAAIYATTDSPEIEEQVTVTVLYLAATAVTWWFGDRAAGNKGIKSK